MRRVNIFILSTALWALVVPNAFAQAELGLKGAGFEVGIVSPDDIDATLGFGLFADFGTLAPHFSLEGYFDFWNKSEDIPGGGDTSLRDIVFGARAKYSFVTRNPVIRPYVGGGLGIHFLHAEVQMPDMVVGGLFVPGLTYDDGDTKLGIDIGGGLNAGIGARTDFVGELWYSIVSDVSQLSLTFGILYKL